VQALEVFVLLYREACACTLDVFFSDTFRKPLLSMSASQIDPTAIDHAIICQADFVANAVCLEVVMKTWGASASSISLDDLSKVIEKTDGKLQGAISSVVREASDNLRAQVFKFEAGKLRKTLSLLNRRTYVAQVAGTQACTCMHP
jgi:hypothetical protein